MKLHVIAVVCLLAAPIVNADESSGDRATTEAKKLAAEAKDAGYDTAAQIKAMPKCTATVKGHHACYSEFKTSTGKTFYIGSPGAGRRVITFLRTLKEGESYDFPGTFLKFEKSVPAYETAEQIKAMPACKATLDEEDVRHGSCFMTSDGKTFYVGSESETPQVAEFLKTLKEGQTYEFPAAFIDYEKKTKR